MHGVWADPLLKNRPVDWIDAEKVYVEGCALLVVIATVMRFRKTEGTEVTGTEETEGTD